LYARPSNRANSGDAIIEEFQRKAKAAADQLFAHGILIPDVGACAIRVETPVYPKIRLAVVP
jgi:hypothetical protein